MPTRANRTLARIVIALCAFAALIVAIGSVPAFLWMTARPLHPEPGQTPSASAFEPAPRWAAAVGRARPIVRAAVSAQNLPGLSVAVGVNGEVVWAEGFGWADVEAEAPVTPDTRFRMGTASPVLTSAAAGALLEQGRVRLDEEIQRYVPQFPKKPWPVTLRQLTGQTSGVGIEEADDWRLSARRCERAAEAVPVFADDPLLFQPGTRVRPSPQGWVLVSAAIEAAGGRPFLSVMRSQVFEPMGMAQTGAEPAQEENPDRIGEEAEDPPPFRAFHEIVLQPWQELMGRRRESDAGGRSRPATYYVPEVGPRPIYRDALRVGSPRNLSCYAGARAFFSTPSDLVRLELGLAGGKLLRPETVQSLETLRRTAGTYDGNLLGATVMSVVTLDRGPVVAVMSNITSADTAGLARRIGEQFGR